MSAAAIKCRECGWPFIPTFEEHVTCEICVKRAENARVETLKQKLATGVTSKCGFDTPPKMFDNVQKPEHYNQGPIECLDAMKAAFGDQVRTYARLNAFKYLWRSDYKHGTEDLRKAIFYLRVALGEDPRK